MADTFEEIVCPVEGAALRARRKAVSDDTPVADSPTVGSALFGVALSGGGIRSAAFSLGVLQALHKIGLARRIDLLSTVSGGGFAGAWVQSLLKSAGTWDKAFETDVAVTHLRQRTSFISPEGRWDWATLVLQMLRGIAGNYLAMLWLPVLAGIVLALGWSWVFADFSVLTKGIYVVTPVAMAVIVGMGLVWLLIGPLVFRRTRDPNGDPRPRQRRHAGDGFVARIVALAAAIVLVETAAVGVRGAHFVWTKSFLSEHPILFGAGLSAVALIVGGVAAGVAGVTRSNLIGWPLTLVAAVCGALPGILAGSYAAVMASCWDGNPGLSPDLWHVVAVFVGLLVLTRWIDPNFTSMHGAARDRLGVSFLVRLEEGQAAAAPDPPLSAMADVGSEAPYPIVTTTLNLQGVGDPALLGRRAEPFVFTRDFYGGKRTGYTPIRWLEWVKPDMNFAAVTALSGAVASANMGVKTRPALTALLVLLNWRMGQWLPHPRRLDAFIRRRALAIRILPEEVTATTSGHAAYLCDRLRWSPSGFYLLRELNGWVHDRTSRVLVTDGGHIENTGIYELLRRRCRYIFCVDADGDPLFQFENLARALLFARLDLGVEVAIDLDPLRPSGRLSEKPVAFGTIRYADGTYGALVVAKPCLHTGVDPVTRSYADEHPTFPHDGLVDQFFSEGQFEAYRALGAHAIAPLRDAMAAVTGPSASLEPVLAPGGIPAPPVAVSPSRPPVTVMPWPTDPIAIGLLLCHAVHLGAKALADRPLRRHQVAVKGPGPLGREPKWKVRCGVLDDVGAPGQVGSQDKARGHRRYIVLTGDGESTAHMVGQSLALTDWAAGTGQVQAWTVPPFEAIWPHVRQAVAEHDGPVVIVGHGVGGALALMCTARIGPRVQMTVVAGTPRIGDRMFAETLRDAHVVRVESVGDPVPRRPAGLRALGELLYLDGSGRTREAPSGPRHWLDRVMWRLFRARRFSKARPDQEVPEVEHTPERYLERYLGGDPARGGVFGYRWPNRRVRRPYIDLRARARRVNRRSGLRSAGEARRPPATSPGHGSGSAVPLPDPPPLP